MQSHHSNIDQKHLRETMLNNLVTENASNLNPIQKDDEIDLKGPLKIFASNTEEQPDCDSFS